MAQRSNQTAIENDFLPAMKPLKKKGLGFDISFIIVYLLVDFSYGVKLVKLVKRSIRQSTSGKVHTTYLDKLEIFHQPFGHNFG